MPLIIPKTLPAYDALYEENVFVMHRERAASQHIRPLEILILNLMPTKIATETQIARLLANTPLQVHIVLNKSLGDGNPELVQQMRQMMERVPLASLVEPTPRLWGR